MHPNGAMETKPSGSGVYIIVLRPLIFFLTLLVPLQYFVPPSWVLDWSIQVDPNLTNQLWQT